MTCKYAKKRILPSFWECLFSGWCINKCQMWQMNETGCGDELADGPIKE